MNKYLGVKLIEAKPMNRSDYNDYRGWELPEDENGEDEGYLVEYTDGGKSNHPKHKGYISWSPKDVFDKAYRVYDTFYDRLLVETQDLADKLNKLHAFLGTPMFAKLDRPNKDLLYEQHRSMSVYVQILGKRLELLGNNFKFKADE